MKTINYTVEADAQKTGMTVGELYGLVREVMAAGLDLDTVVEVRVGWRGQLQKITVDGQVTDAVRTVDLDGPEAGDG